MIIVVSAFLIVVGLYYSAKIEKRELFLAMWQNKYEKELKLPDSSIIFLKIKM